MFEQPSSLISAVRNGYLNDLRTYYETNLILQALRRLTIVPGMHVTRYNVLLQVYFEGDSEMTRFLSLS